MTEQLLKPVATSISVVVTRITKQQLQNLASAAMEDDPREAGPATMAIIDECRRAREREVELENALAVTGEEGSEIVGELKSALAASQEENAKLKAENHGLRSALTWFVEWCDRNDWGSVPKKLETQVRAALEGKP